MTQRDGAGLADTDSLALPLPNATRKMLLELQDMIAQLEFEMSSVTLDGHSDHGSMLRRLEGLKSSFEALLDNCRTPE